MSCLLTAAPAPAAGKDAPAAKSIPIAKVGKRVDFDRDILPFFRQSCLPCHNRTTTKAGLILETPEDIRKGGDSGKAVVPGRGAGSLLVKVAAHQTDPAMPPPGNKASAPNLTPEQLGLLKAWIDQGAKGQARREVAIEWQPLPSGLNPIYAVAVSPDGQFAACARANQIHIHHLPTGRLVERLNDPQLQKSGLYARPGVAHRDMVFSLAFSPDGSLLASGSYREVKLWQRPVQPVKFSLHYADREKALCIALSPDGQWLVSGHADGKLRVHEVASGKLRKTAPVHQAAVTALRFSPNGERLASAGGDKRLVITSTATWKPAPDAELTQPATALAWTDDSRHLITGEDKSIRVWKLPDDPKGKLAQLAELKGHEGVVTALDTVTSTNTLVLSGSADGSVRLWDLAKGEAIRTMAHGGSVTSVAASPDGKRFASAGTNSITRLWQAGDGRPLAEIKGDHFAREEIGARERALALANAGIEHCKKALADGEKEAQSQGERLKKANEALAAADKTLAEKKKTLDDAVTAKALAEKELADIESPLKKAQADFDAAQKAKAGAEAALKAAKEKGEAADKDQAARLEQELAAKAKMEADTKVILDLVAAGLKPKQQPAQDKVKNAEGARANAEGEFKKAERARSIAENEQQLATKAEAKAKTDVEDAKAALKTAEEAKTSAETALASAKKLAAESEAPVRAAAFLPDNVTLLTAGDDRRLHAWSAENGAAFANCSGHTKAVLALSIGAGLAASLSVDGTAKVWDLRGGWTLAKTLGAGGAGSPLVDRVTALAFSPDGQWLASGGGVPSREGEVAVWSVADGALTNQFRGVHSDVVLALEFSPDGKFLASGSADRFARVVDARKGAVVKTFEGHTHHVHGVAWKADGRTLASAGGDKAVKIWDFVTGDRKRNIEGYGKEVTSVHFIGITDQMVTTAGDNRVRILKEDGGEVKNLGTGDYMQASAVTPDGKVIIAGGQDSVLLVWTDLSKEPQRFKPEETKPPEPKLARQKE